MRVYNFSQMQQLLRNKLTEPNSSNTTWSGTYWTQYFKDVLNYAINYFCTARPFRFMESEFDLSTNFSSASASGTTISASSATGFSTGIYGYVYDSSGNAERFQTSSVSGGTITATNSMYGSYTASSYICRETYDMPDDFFHVKSVRDLTLSATSTSSLMLKQSKIGKFDYDTARITSKAAPSNYLFWGLDTLKEPSTGTITASTGSTTTLTSATLSSSATGHYNNWVCVNTTRTDQSRVLSYNGGTKTITLQKAITSQAADAFFLQKNLLQMGFDTLMDEIRTYRIRYYRFHPELVNDYDIPYIPAEFIMGVIDGAAGQIMCADGKEQRGQFYLNSMMNEIKRCYEIWGSKDNFDTLAEWGFYDNNYAGNPQYDKI